MKTLLSLFVLFAAFCSRAELPSPRNIPLAWDYNAPLAGVTFYLRETNVAGAVVLGVTTNTSFTLTNVIPALYKWSVTASNAFWGETPPSAPYITPTPAITPVNLRPQNTTFRVVPPVTLERQGEFASERLRLFRPDSNGVMIVLHTVSDADLLAPFTIRPDPKPVK